jgi:protein OS-9
MRNLVIYASALASLSPAWAFRPGPHQLRDLLAFPKYSVDFLNETPLSATDAAKCRSEGVELEDDFIQTRFTGEGARRRLNGNDTRDGEGKRDPSKVC